MGEHQARLLSPVGRYFGPGKTSRPAFKDSLLSIDIWDLQASAAYATGLVLALCVSHPQGLGEVDLLGFEWPAQAHHPTLTAT